MTNIIIGPPVKGEDLYDRDEVIDLIWKKIYNSSILLVAPRKFGKTSIMFNFRDNPRNEFKVFYMDYEHITSPSEFIIELLKELSKESDIWQKTYQRIKKLFSSSLSRVEEVGLSEIKIRLREGEEKDWKDLGGELIKILTSMDFNIILILDEFPLMIKTFIENDENGAKTFLRWFHSIRQTIDSKNKLRFIIGGSIGIERLLDEIGEIPSISDLERIKVGEFPDDIARQFIKELFLSENIDINGDIIDKIMSTVGTSIPYFIQIVITEVLKEARYEDKKITTELIDWVYENIVLGVDCRTYFQHYRSRLKEYYEPNKEKAIIELLRIVAKNNRVTKLELYQRYLDEMNKTDDKDGFGYLMSELQNDFYLRFNPDGSIYSFDSKILRDWWYRFYEIEDKR